MKINHKTFSQFFTLSSGSIISLIVNLLALVIFSRIYSKENFGDYAIFVSVVSLLSILSTFRIEHLIVLKKTIKEAAFLSKICKKIILYFVIILFFICVLLYILSIPFFNLQPYTWLFIPISVYCLSHIIIFLSWNNKIKNYKLIANFKILQSLSVVVVGVFLNNYIKEIGLILAYFFGLLASFVLFNYSFKNIIKKHNLNLIKLIEIKSVFFDNKDYIKTSFGLEFFNTIGKFMPNFILNAYYGNGIVGIYDMTLKVLNIPKNIISLNIGELYYQKASVFYHKSLVKFSNITLQTFYTLFIISVICYLPFILYGEELFTFVLGEEWSLSGRFSKIIAIWFIFLFVNSPMAYIFYIKDTLRKLFWYIFISFIIKTGLLFYFSFNNNEITTINNYTILCILLEVFLIFLILKQRKININK